MFDKKYFEDSQEDHNDPKNDVGNCFWRHEAGM